MQDYFKETYGRETHFIPNGVNRPQIRKANLITEKFGLKKDSYILFLGRLVPEKVLVDADLRRKKRKKVIDMMAAVVILQNYLDSKSFKI